MFSKPLTEITYSDIVDLVVTQNQPEGQNLDYKKDFGNNLDRAKKELAKDVSAFANTGGGGYLILGVSNDNQIVGVDSIINNRPIVEWINQVLSSNIVPSVHYEDPHIIPIPDTEKIILVMFVSESIGKPHMVAEDHAYYIRINDQCKPANHYQVRDMFDFSRNRGNELQDFLKSRNLYEVDSKDFGKNINSNSLWNFYFQAGNNFLPKLIYSLIPKNIIEEKVNLPIEEFKEWLKKNTNGYLPDKNFNLFYAHYNEEIKLDGLTLKNQKQTYYSSYFEFLYNGYVEAGLSESIFSIFNDIKYAHLTSILGYELAFLGFAKRFYEFLNYYDEVQLQLSFVIVKDIQLSGLYKDQQIRPGSGIMNKHHKNFAITHTFVPNDLTDEKIKLIVEKHSEKICNAFGLSSNYGTVNGMIDMQLFDSFRL